MVVRHLYENVDYKNRIKDRASEMALVNERLCFLRAGDRRFMQLCFHYGMSVKRISQITGIGRRAVGLRITRLKRLLLCREKLIACVGNSSLSEVEKEMAYDHVANNIGYRRLAQKYKVTEYRARKIVAGLRLGRD